MRLSSNFLLHCFNLFPPLLLILTFFLEFSLSSYLVQLKLLRWEIIRALFLYVGNPGISTALCLLIPRTSLKFALWLSMILPTWREGTNYILAVTVENILTRVKVIMSMGLEQEESNALTFLAFCSTEPCSVDYPELHFRLKTQRRYQSLSSKCHAHASLVLGHTWNYETSTLIFFNFYFFSTLF